ncbi:MAG: hypothetical protein WCO64_04460 [Actinomycetes bacterium]
MAKWRILLKSLPLALIVLGLRFLIHNVDKKSGILQFSDSSSVLTGAALIMGLMLSGVIGDYRESEKLPSDVGGGLLGFELYATRGLQVIDKDSAWIHPRLVPIAHSINDWFYGRKTDAQLWADYDDVNQIVVELSKSGVTIPYLNQVHSANNGVAGAIDRISVIRNTTYIKAGYALMEFLIAVVLGLMVIVDFPEGLAQWLVPASISVVYVYMFLFIKDLDNPFGYAENHGTGSAADVALDGWKNAFTSFTK